MDSKANIDEIKRDLSFAQGCVAASIESLDNSASAPPTEKLKKETEKTFNESCGDVDYSRPPECGLKKEMQTEVKNKYEKEEVNEDILLKSNLNPLSAEFVPGDRQKTGAVKKKGGGRKEAIRSISQNMEMTSPVQEGPIILTSPINMFRTKCSLNTERKSASLERQIFSLSSSHSDPSVSSCQYIPSSEANVYYNTFMERTTIKSDITQDIWSKIEEEMKRKDEMVRRRRYCSCTQSSSGEVAANSCFKCDNGLHGSIALEFPRHTLLDNVEDCVVCSVTRKHGYNVDEKSL
ncbi:unnamed protein product [Arctia plantaginis]|uniref:Uncharacterized protein n=1 Tax=Arctia plantaginis TaxID=874455 RepID=A0A8S1AGH4_ARCPL|nr:unnamed protein product [Arctia plantaginis]CAB3252990.1 unnamed protein product [Arctia plantaginis]